MLHDTPAVEEPSERDIEKYRDRWRDLLTRTNTKRIAGIISD